MLDNTEKTSGDEKANDLSPVFRTRTPPKFTFQAYLLPKNYNCSFS